MLSIIRLRSSEITQREVAYYFAALAMGLIAGLGGLAASESRWINYSLIGLVLATMFAGDHPALLGRYRQQVITRDSVHADELVTLRVRRRTSDDGLGTRSPRR